MEQGKLFIISGFSGAGKGTVVRGLLDRKPEYALSISATTRPPREGEIEGKHYYFMSKDKFSAMIEEDDFYEYTSYLNHYYGTPKSFVKRQLDEGIDVVLEIEMQGALQVKAIEKEAVLIFIIPPKADILKRRLINRNTESRTVIMKRLAKSYRETAQISHYDYIVMNDQLEVCIEDILAIIRAEKIKLTNKQKWIDKFNQEFETLLNESEELPC